MRFFVGRGAFIALMDGDDENHKAAAALYRDSREKRIRFVTTNFIVCETMIYLRAKISTVDSCNVVSEVFLRNAIFQAQAINLAQKSKPDSKQKIHSTISLNRLKSGQ